MILDSDAPAYGGHGRLCPDQRHFTTVEKSGETVRHRLSLYLPTRTALVLSPVDKGVDTEGHGAYTLEGV